MMIRMATPAAAMATAAVWRISSAALVGVTKMPPETTWKYMIKSSAETKRTAVLAVIRRRIRKRRRAAGKCAGGRDVCLAHHGFVAPVAADNSS